MLQALYSSSSYTLLLLYFSQSYTFSISSSYQRRVPLSLTFSQSHLTPNSFKLLILPSPQSYLINLIFFSLSIFLISLRHCLALFSISSSSQSHTLSILCPLNLIPSQSHTLSISYPLNLMPSQSHTLSISYPLNLIPSQSHTLSISHSVDLMQLSTSYSLHLHTFYNLYILFWSHYPIILAILLHEVFFVVAAFHLYHHPSSFFPPVFQVLIHRQDNVLPLMVINTAASSIRPHPSLLRSVGQNFLWKWNHSGGVAVSQQW
ncbi:hypothetical protein B0H63DRAFT_304005 [Podospora didyma]|uniref:Uncharacterized protein n=1 Tax=Podospora didyma TaxID=330526 RepID=A0AAE0K595_9PEZI|nr:hypothetical protein B0H63DRAFT_304005 [Podospora didyma]